MALGKRGPFARQRASLLARRGRSYRAKGLLAQAVGAFSAAAALCPNDPRHHLDHGISHLQIGNHVAAQHALQRSLALAPAQPGAWLKLGEAFAGQGLTEFALRAHRAALTFDPWSSAATQALESAGHGTDVRLAAIGASDILGSHTSQIHALTRHFNQLLEHLTTMKALSLEMVTRGRDIKGISSEVEDLQRRMAVVADRQDVDHDLTISALAALEDTRTRIEAQVLAGAEDLASSLDLRLEALRREQKNDLTSLEKALAGQAVNVENARKQQGAISERIEAITLRQDAIENRSIPNPAADGLSANFIEQAADTLTYLTGRVEFVRRELLYEFHHGPRREHFDEANLRVPSKIVNRARVDAEAATGLKLNLGCGHILLDGYLNVDRRELPGVDIVAEVDAIPVPAASVAEIHSAHLLEHFPKEELIRKILPYWRSLLRPGGVFSAVVPDGEAMMTQWAKGDYPFDDLREVMFGAQDYMGDYHYNIFTPDSLSKILADQGFQDISVIESGRRNGQCFELEIKARLSENALESSASITSLMSRSEPTF